MPHDILPFVGKTSLLFALMLLTAPVVADSLSPETLHLARIQNKAKLGLSNIPAYTCSEVMERSSRPASRYQFRQTDVLRLEVAEIGGRELFSKAGDKSFSDLGIKEFANRGLIATGMFYQLAQTVFGTPVAHFQFAGSKRIKGHRTLQYQIQVAPLFANYRLNFNYHEARCGFRGSIWADETSFDLIRMSIEATDIPPELLLTKATTEIDYTRASLDGNSYLIPSSAEITTTFLNGSESRNQIRFSNCHKYGVESTVTFQ